ncbi:tRNA pseudouridine(38-40) synthase TruA [Agromyces seonyuensis]|uniref:tRNA pseudouridine synthase A n=1 Tax=Agromyces seonyuensis TaxID=2662446 RepID=A0A6I4P861_9MICO|nr:tRNA pseudouridine(38-40) synthase TruA [Agromyces seonyuensis]MWC00088.1 tRNA pseudouridine(38-40) synthase TruA [Agromyces seonyuensis]
MADEQTEPVGAPAADPADPPLEGPAPGSRRIRLGIAYDGTDFAGWARQPTLRTVQGAIEEALATLFRRHGEPLRLTVAGRTDAGVHAIGQVAHVDLTEGQLAALTSPKRARNASGDADAAAALRRRLTGILGLDSDVAITGASFAPDGFDARFAAVWRRYEYRIADARALPDPLRRHDTVRLPKALDESAMDAAARSLVGLHDFAAYCKPREGATTIRTLQRFEWSRGADGVVTAKLQADAFCHSMVRALVGASVAVGEGRLGADDPRRLLDAAERTSAFLVMPAKGLTLTEVGYPDDAELSARAAQTRNRRGAHELRIPPLID